jgi:membrane associated rhomboid family serine protease
MAQIQPRPSVRELVRELKTDGWILGSILGAMWVVEFANVITAYSFVGFGIRPRSVEGVLGALVLLRETSHFFAVTAAAMFLGGLGTWLVGSGNSVHVGASGLVFGYLGYLLGIGIFERRVGAVIVSGLVTLAFGSLLWGILPTGPGISWEGHLFGFLAGLLTSRVLARHTQRAAKLNAEGRGG